MLGNLKKGLIYAVILGLFLTAYQMYGQPLWNAWLQSKGQTVGFFETFGGYALAIMLGLVARAMMWRVKGT